MPVSSLTARTAPKVDTPPANPEKKKLKEACQNFEAIFVGQMLKEMRPQGDDPVFGGSHARKIYESMQDEQMAQHLTSKRSPLGVGELLYRQLAEKVDATAKSAETAPRLGGKRSAEQGALDSAFKATPLPSGVPPVQNDW
ncbi:rod-binding protein [Desulfoluna spongiiphila]|uniref:Rod binding protein n=1 Tax=Desulfoluna spongiiphila TaxID=419481 RepID=A0A1G5J4C5_9BACT|nr:rod-binding protein [Desulfoluna spongiiphila]SCY82689.1 Rod binding protein [Desulfoluna spongiiphila]VVS94458.1 cj1463 jhp0230 hp0245 [Desulfoluna spongiiphila]